MRSVLVLISILGLIGPACSSELPFRVAGHQVVCGAARFDVLAPDLIRMQYAANGFVDAPSAVVTNRSLQSHAFHVRHSAGWLTIQTPVVKLRYKIGSGRFHSDNLIAAWMDAQGRHEWRWGAVDQKNLGGPVSSFNAIIEQTKPENMLPTFPVGPLSRSGYWLWDDSRTPVWNAATDWIEPRTDMTAQDWYLFVYGRDYARLYKRFSALMGVIPMIPRYALGAWVTDWNFEFNHQPVDAEEIFRIVQRFRTERIPLDVFVFDFAWHPYGWQGSLDWSPFVPDPPAFLKRLKQAGLRVALNDHPSSGLSPRDSRAEEARRLLGLGPMNTDTFVDLSEGWRFRTDPTNIGLTEGWHLRDFDDIPWQIAKEPAPWEAYLAPGYDGVAWYRRWVEAGDRFQQGPAYISFGGVDDEYDLYVNGQFVKHFGELGKSVYDQRTSIDIAPYLSESGRNLVALRVTDWGHNGGLLQPACLTADLRQVNTNVYFNLAEKTAAELYMRYHNELIDQGVDFWWIDGDFAQMPGLDAQMWTNRVYYDYTQRHTGQRAFVFSRYGGPGSHRYPAFFTADCYSNWKVLAWEIPYTLTAGNALVPWVTHDIGGFIGELTNEFELYARWLQFGAFSPILRLHSAHANLEQGNPRLPWNYGERGIRTARELFQLRYRLLPYLYTAAWQTHRTGIPICRPMYLNWPEYEDAYRMDQYLFGPDLLVAPVTTPMFDGAATRSIWIPPGGWIDWFTGQTYTGPRVITYRCPLERMPLFVRQGSVLPMQPDMPYTSAFPVDPLILDIRPGRPHGSMLYEDDGISLNYRRGEYRRTPIRLTGSGRRWTVSVGPTSGVCPGLPLRKRYELRWHTPRRPVRVTLQGRPVRCSWDPRTRVATVSIHAEPLCQRVQVMW